MESHILVAKDEKLVAFFVPKICVYGKKAVILQRKMRIVDNFVMKKSFLFVLLCAVAQIAWAQNPGAFLCPFFLNHFDPNIFYVYI